MHNQSRIQLLEPLRASLADRMAAFERVNGPITTLPIRRSLNPSKGLTVSSEAKRMAKSRKRGAMKSNEASRSPDTTQPAPTPLAERRTRQTRERAVLRQEWPH